jgi:glycosyltransferase involved in cell wall biosynthesis
MKVLMLLPHVASSGGWVMVRTLSRHLKALGYTCHLGGDGADDADQAIFDRTFQLPINHGWTGFLRCLRKIFQFDKDIRLIHVHSTNTLLFACVLRLLRCSKAAIIYTHHLDVHESPSVRRIKKLLFSRCDRLHCATIDLAKRFGDLYGQDSARVTQIPLGADEHVFYPADRQEKTRLRQEFHIDPESLVIVFVGRLNPEKNLSLLLRTLSENREKQPRLRLIVAGQGPLKPELETQAAELSLKEHVIFLGNVTSLRKVYAVSDLLVLPSYTETFGLVVVEAALCGVPALRSNTFGAADQIIEGVNGAIFDPSEPASFSKKLSDLLRSPKRLKQMGDDARRRALQEFTAIRMAKRFDEVFRNLTTQDARREEEVIRA